MNQIFLLLVHKNPQQLLLFLEQLECPESFFLVHVDHKSKIKNFLPIATKINNIRFIEERYNVGWGSYNMIKATLALVKAANSLNIEYSHAHLLSGEDILIKPQKELFHFFSKNPNLDYVDFFSLPCKYWKNGGLERISRYYFGNFNKQGHFILRIPIKIIELLVNNIIVLIFPSLKKHLRNDICYYGGSQWWSITKESINFILDFVKDNPDFNKFYTYSFIPDEMFFQTILLNSKFKSKVIADNKRFIDWSKAENGSPTYLKIEDYENLVKTDSFFARKVDFLNAGMFYKMF